ncbi:ribonuclease G [bacterium BMS3Abin05]|nr:ribonuclease G [bacterium BMS3Abin05]GBE26977.1 ribonuclease G [bacterium BMS3Bbin03]HDL78534.1 Rne/Rng family ribonuclease [Bacteroidota bacterium]
MQKDIIINVTITGTRVAILEDGQLAELFVERPEQERMVGDIYKGVVENVIKGMGAAFVDIGHEQNAFLRFSDIGDFFDSYGPILSEDDEDGAYWKAMDQEKARKGVPLVTGQEILVQVAKEPISTKGARVTSEISIPGRFMVLVPGYDHVGVSRKIENFRERKRLKRIAYKIRPKGFGIIIRTAASEKDETVLKADLDNLLRTWEKIEKHAKKEKAPVLVYKEMGMVSSIIRDLFTQDVTRVVVDSRKLNREVMHYLKDVAPHLMPRLEFYKGMKPIFDEFNIEKEINKSLSRKVWLKSGGYIVIDQTEALVAIDVNSGKYVSRGEHEESSLKINLEAVKEISRQLRLRDLGGIIVIDFIDMHDERNKMKVYTELKKELRKDRSKTSISQLSEFGLIEMTRERVRPSLLFDFLETCPVCEGVGYVPSSPTVAAKIEQAIRRLRAQRKERRIQLILHPEMKKYLMDGLWNRARKLMLKYMLTINITGDETLHYGQFRIILKKTGEDITKECLGAIQNGSP